MGSSSTQLQREQRSNYGLLIVPGEVGVEWAEATWALAGQGLHSPVELYSLAGADLTSP